MILLYRARLLFVGAVFAAAVLLALELPISELVHQQSQLNASSSQLARIESRNAALRADVAALRENSAIAAIAHEEYGLVDPGQRSYVILPARGEGSASGVLGGRSSIPASDLVLGPANVATSPAVARRAPGGPPGLAGRVVNRLEFWRWAL